MVGGSEVCGSKDGGSEGVVMVSEMVKGSKEVVVRGSEVKGDLEI